MCKTNEGQQLSSLEQENARVGYQSAVNLWIYEGTQIWVKFTAMVYSNTIVLATVGIVMTSPRWKDLPILTIALAILGIIFCVCWYILNKRSFAYYKYWIWSSRELEEKYLKPVQTVSRGGEFADGKEALFNIGGKDLPHQCKGIEKFRVEIVSNIIIFIFVLMYLTILFHHL